MHALVVALLLAACAGGGTPGGPAASSAGTATAQTMASRTPSGSATRTPTGSPTRTPPATPATTATRTPAATPSVTAGRSAWVAVSVATLWRSPSSPRTVDRPALTAPAGIRTWLVRMTLSDRRGLVGRADTQALLGDRVVVLARSGSWAKVVVPDQPTPLDRRGYPGWVPLVQLTARAPAPTALVATVTAGTTWLRSDDTAGTRVVEVSFGTRLPRIGAAGGWARVVTPTGRVLRVSASAVAVRAPSAPALTATGADLVRTAQRFGGLPYLWAGRSGFGFDCSGLTSLDYRVHGIVIPRDADAQAVRGRAVARSALRPGDLLFYASGGHVHHVSMYAGGGRMVQSPRTGSTVETIPVATESYAREYSGARRFL